MKLAQILAVLLVIAIPLSGANSDPIGALRVFPADNPWNWDISAHEVHPNSDNFINSIGASTTLHPDFGTMWAGAPNGIPYITVKNSEPKIPITYTAYGDESDPGPFPIPLDAPIEGGPTSDGDRHVIAVDTDNKMLYELYRAFPQTSNWEAMSGAAFDLSINDHHPETWTSADAAGLPIFPGLVRYEEVYIKKEITHALRFTVENSQRKYIFPARHYASSSTDPNRPPMGLRFRLKAGYDITGFSEPIQVILRAFKKHGIIVADNGGDWFISGAPDDRWDDDVLREIKQLKGSDFEAVKTVDANGDPIYPTGINHNSADLSQEKPEILICHDPIRSVVLIQLNKMASGTIKLVDISGKIQASKKVTSKLLYFNISKLNSGIYLLNFPACTFLTPLIIYR